jgi:hypothetical protein
MNGGKGTRTLLHPASGNCIIATARKLALLLAAAWKTGKQKPESETKPNAEFR